MVCEGEDFPISRPSWKAPVLDIQKLFFKRNKDPFPRLLRSANRSV